MSLVRYIKLDISRLEREQKKEVKRMKKLGRGSHEMQSQLLSYIISRKQTLKEILPLIQKETLSQ